MPIEAHADVLFPETPKKRRAAWQVALSGIGWLDAVLAILGLAMGWMSLTFPFGRDQGLYHYVAREWVVNGAVPYRDVLDHKTPGIYLVHALAIRLFGVNMWGIRALDMVAMLLTGLLAAALSAERGQAIRPGVRGAAIFTTAIFFYGSLTFWDLSQSEVWYGMLGLASVWAAIRLDKLAVAETLAGLFAALALVMKPPALWFVLITVFVLAQRVRRERAPLSIAPVARSLARFLGGGAAVVVPLFGYFAIQGALPDMYEIVVRSNAYYAAHETQVDSLDAAIRLLLEMCQLYSFQIALLTFGLVLGLGFAWGKGDEPARDRHVLACALGIAGLLAVVMQMKFYWLHFTILLAPAAVIGANLAADCRAFLPRVGKHVLAPLAFVLPLVGTWWISPGRTHWFAENEHVLRYLDDEIGPDEFARFFQVPKLGFFYEDSLKVGRWLREHSEPNDTVAVRGFQPEIYAVADRHYPGRFFWTTFLTSPTRGEPDMVERWREEERRLLEVYPPRYAVAIPMPEGHDSPAWFLRLGYVVREVIGPYTILERPRPQVGHTGG